jgi:hypothetical protein
MSEGKICLCIYYLKSDNTCAASNYMEVFTHNLALHSNRLLTAAKATMFHFPWGTNIIRFGHIFT